MMEAQSRGTCSNAAAALLTRTHEARSFEEAMDLCRRSGWTDGHPVVPPTDTRVAEFLAEACYEPGEVIGISKYRNRTLTALHVVVNSVMAGCQPMHVPVVVAALRAILSPGFHHNYLASLGGPWPYFIVSGPVVERLDLNFDDGTMGPAGASNSVIARAISLVLWNGLEQRPGGVQRGAYGAPWRNESVIAERPDSRWPPLHVERGFDVNASMVTVFPTGGDFEFVRIHRTDCAEHILAPIVDSLSKGRFAWGPYMVVLPPNLIDRLDSEGWNKADVRAYIIERSQRSIAGLKRRLRWAEQQAGRHPWYELLEVQAGDEQQMIYLFKRQPEFHDLAFRDKFQDSREAELLLVNSGGAKGNTACIFVPYAESGPAVQSAAIESRR